MYMIEVSLLRTRRHFLVGTHVRSTDWQRASEAEAGDDMGTVWLRLVAVFLLMERALQSEIFLSTDCASFKFPES